MNEEPETRKAGAWNWVAARMSGPLELASVAAATVVGWTMATWARALARRHGHTLLEARLGALGGTFRTSTSVQITDELTVRVREVGGGFRLEVVAQVPGLESGAELAVVPPKASCPVALLHLGLVREGLIRPELDVVAESERVLVGQWTEALPSSTRMRALLERVERAAELARSSATDGGRHGIVRGLIHPHPEVRLCAAQVAGHIGVPILLRLLRDERHGEDLRIRAGKALVGRATASEMAEAFRCVTRSSAAPVAEFGARRLAELDDEDGGLALSALPGARLPAQRVLLDYLAEQGGPAAHVALDDLLSRGGLGVRLDGALRRAARASAARHRGRGGRLSLCAESQAGALSEGEAVPGRRRQAR